MSEDNDIGSAGITGETDIKNKKSGDKDRLSRLRATASELPLCPGVYIMRDKNNAVIYVGKSRVLKNRVSQYFAEAGHYGKTEKMVSCVDRFETIICKTEMEALTLEASLIKRYEPKYNIKLKDAKAYPYIKVDIGADYPRMYLCRKRGREKSGEALYFGPYASGSAVRDIITSVERTFSIPACQYVFPRDIGRVRSCVYDQMGRCCGVCRGVITPAEYKEIIKSVVTVLRGDIASAKAELQSKMESFAEEENFEAAARCRDSIAALSRLKEKQHVVASPDTEKDIIAYYSDPDGICCCATLLVIRGGALADKQNFEFGAGQLMDENGIGGEGGISDFLCTLYSAREYIPREILISFSLEEQEAAAVCEFLSETAGHKVTLHTPERGESRKLVQLAEENAKIAADLYKAKAKSDENVLIKLASMLSLEVVPQRIECFDISNLGSEHITAGMITAVDAKLKKSDYKLFSVAGDGKPDDYAAMSEALTRRLGHPEWGEFPDLILLDGGAGHVNVCRRAVAAAGYDIPVFGMVKDEHHKTRSVVGGSEDEEIQIAREQAVFQFVYKLQEEVHRFTITSMTRAKRNTLRKSSLQVVEGIGPAKAKILLSRFGTMTALRAAGCDEIATTSGISEKNAADVYAFLHKNDNKNIKE